MTFKNTNRQQNKIKKLLRLSTVVLVSFAAVQLTTDQPTHAVTTTTSFPSSLQLYPRDKVTNQATVEIDGIEDDATVDTIRLKIYKNGTLINAIDQSTTFSGGTASFSFSPTINAELSNYDFELYQIRSGSETLTQSADDVVAGDAYLVNGQSNAVAPTRFIGDTGLSHPFVRTFGQLDNSPPVAIDTAWRIAKVDDVQNDNGFIGHLGYNFALDIVNSESIPIVIMNGASGGQSIDYFQTVYNDAPYPNNYNRLLERVQVAGLDQDISGIIWNQGEAAILPLGLQTTLFNALVNDWKTDYPGVYPVYSAQISKRLNSFTFSAGLIQRELMTDLNDINEVRVFSTTNIYDPISTDDLHYSPQGYSDLAIFVSNMALKDIYGQAYDNTVYSPDVNTIYCANVACDELILELDNNADLMIDGSQPHNFILQNCTMPLSINSIAVESINSLRFNILQTNVDTLCSAGTLDYLGTNIISSPHLTNKNGVGVLAFKGPQILPWLDTDGDGLGDYEELASSTDENDMCDPLELDDSCDPDKDGLTNSQEQTFGSNPNNPDTDGGGVNDGDELANGTDPNVLGDDYSNAQPSVSITDPYTCGGNIHGQVLGGTAPHTVTVNLTPTDSSSNLPNYTFSPNVDFEGNWSIPIDYTNPASQYYIQQGSYANTYGVTDANNQTAQGSYSLAITDDCEEELAETSGEDQQVEVGNEQLAETGSNTQTLVLSGLAIPFAALATAWLSGSVNERRTTKGA